MAEVSEETPEVSEEANVVGSSEGAEPVGVADDHDNDGVFTYFDAPLPKLPPYKKGLVSIPPPNVREWRMTHDNTFEFSESDDLEVLRGKLRMLVQADQAFSPHHGKFIYYPFAPMITNKTEVEIFSPQLLDRFALMKTLTDDWDQCGADPVPPERIEYAEKTILRMLKQGYPEPTIGATPCGDVDIVWDDCGVYAVLAEPEFGLKVTLIIPDSLYEVKKHPYKASLQVDKFFAQILSTALDRSRSQRSVIKC